MTVKTGTAWAGLFVTLDATGAASAADSAPTGTLYVDGASDAATVTITGSNPYKFAVTLPTLTAGQRVDMYITATIDTIATAGIVASAQADTVLLSDGVTLADDAITAAKFDESTAYPLKSADTGSTQVARVGADSDTLETLSDEIAAIAMLSEVVVGSYTVQDILKILAAKTVGKATGAETTTITYRGVDDTSNVVVETVDSKGNRSAVTLTV